MNQKQADEYERMLKEGNRRFGSPCRHTAITNGVCRNCLRRVRS